MHFTPFIDILLPQNLSFRLCEEQRDEAIQTTFIAGAEEKQRQKISGSLRRKDASRRRRELFRSPVASVARGWALPQNLSFVFARSSATKQSRWSLSRARRKSKDKRFLDRFAALAKTRENFRIASAKKPPDEETKRLIKKLSDSHNSQARWLSAYRAPRTSAALCLSRRRGKYFNV